jgi:hypothetical protein
LESAFGLGVIHGRSILIERPSNLSQGLGHVGGFGNSDDGNLKIGLAELRLKNPCGCVGRQSR